MRKSLKLIIIENDDNDFELLKFKLIDAGYELDKLQRVQTATEFNEAIVSSSWDIILSDFSLPQFDALTALTILKQADLDFPLIVISGTIGEERAATALRTGARDFVAKSDLNRLIPVIERELRELSSRKLRRKVEQAFKASEQRYKLIVNTAREGIITLNETGKITFVNKEMARLLGYHEQDILNKELLEFVKTNDYPNNMEFIREIIKDSTGQNTYLFKNSMGHDWWGSTRISSIEESGGNSYLCMITDVTEHVESRKRVDALVKTLESALSARDEFLSIASHELKTPLTSLLIQAQQQRRMMMKGSPVAFEKDRIIQITEQTEKSVLRLNRLVEDMLDISRIRSGKLSIQKERVDLKALTREVIKKISVQFTHSNSGVPDYYEIEPEIIGFWDPIRIEQVISNLLTNAYKYGEGKPIMVRVAQDGTDALLSVEDQGPGIEEKAQEIIFNRFERATNPNEVSGLGLGLFITKEIVHAHQGKVWVESKPGKGSNFFLRLPINS